MTVDAYTGDEDLFGKYVDDLQTGVTFGANGEVTGTLSYVEDYTDFSPTASEQEGHYLAIEVDAGNIQNLSVTAKITEVSIVGTNGIAVLRVTDTTKKLVITANAPGYAETVKEFDISGLTLAPKEE